MAEPTSRAGVVADGAPPAAPRTLGEILQEFPAHIPPVKLSASYRLGLLLVTVAMVLLPLLYLAFIALVGYGVYYHAVHDVTLLEGARGRSMRGALMLYLLPIIAGGILILFMIKPLFAPRPPRPRPRTLAPGESPLLQELVERLCRAVGAPVPREIHLDCEVNASASFRRGLLSLFGNDLVLTVGLPLVSGLTLRQFAGVLAHEFGHFAQGAGMRLTYLIRSVNGWFARVAYERDAWDLRLIALSAENKNAFGLILYVARACVWLTRQLLIGFLKLGHLISCFALRQMEYDADRYETRLAGSDGFESTARRLPVLATAWRGATERLDDLWRQRRLAEDFPRLVASTEREIPPELLESLARQSREEKTSLFATHPADRDRIASARRENARGLFLDERPAQDLFTDFAAVSKSVTRLFYHNAIGEEAAGVVLSSGESIEAERARELKRAGALRRFVQIPPPFPRVIPFPAQVSPPEDFEAGANLLRATRKRVEESWEAYRAARERFIAADEKWAACVQARARAGLEVAKAGLPDGPGNQGVHRLEKEAVEAREAAAGELDSFESAQAERLTRALELAKAPQAQARQGAVDATVQGLDCRVDLLSKLGALFGSFREGRERQQRLTACARGPGDEEPDEKLGSMVEWHSVKLHEWLCRAKAQADLIPHSLPDAGQPGPGTLGAFAVPRVPYSKDADAVLQASVALMKDALEAYQRTLAQLAEIAEEVERAIGLEPLPERAVKRAES